MYLDGSHPENGDRPDVPPIHVQANGTTDGQGSPKTPEPHLGDAPLRNISRNIKITRVPHRNPYWEGRGRSETGPQREGQTPRPSRSKGSDRVLHFKPGAPTLPRTCLITRGPPIYSGGPLLRPKASSAGGTTAGAGPYVPLPQGFHPNRGHPGVAQE